MGDKVFTTTPCGSCGARVLARSAVPIRRPPSFGRRGCLPHRPSFVIFNAQNPFVHSSEFQRAEVYIPDPIVDFFETDVLAGERVRDTDPVMVPADAAVATDQTDFDADSDPPDRVSPPARADRSTCRPFCD